jgi:hypothetical protein
VRKCRFSAHFRTLALTSAFDPLRTSIIGSLIRCCVARFWKVGVIIALGGALALALWNGWYNG